MQWKDIEGYEGLYKISDSGLVLTLGRKAFCGHGYRITKDKLLKQKLDRYGYTVVYLIKDGKMKTKKLHRLLMETFVGKSSLTVNHKDGNKNNNLLTNLEYLSSSDNLKHAHKLGLFKEGYLNRKERKRLRRNLI